LTGCSVDTCNLGDMVVSNSTTAGTYSSLLAMIDGLVGIDTLYATHGNCGSRGGNSAEVTYNTSVLLQCRKSVHRQLSDKYPTQTLQAAIMRNSSCASEMRANLRLLAGQLGTCNGMQWLVGASSPSAHDITYSMKHSHLSFGVLPHVSSTTTAAPSVVPKVRMTPQFTTALHDLYQLGGSVVAFGCGMNAVLKNKQTAQVLISNVLLAMPYATTTSTAGSTSGDSDDSGGGGGAGDSVQNTAHTWNAVQKMICNAETIAPVPASAARATEKRKTSLDAEIQALFAAARNPDLLAQAPITWGAYM